MAQGHIFISYKREDKVFALELKQQLIDSGFETWMDESIPPGRKWRDEIDDKLRESSVIVLVVTPESMKSQYVNYEWIFGLGVGAEVIPIYLKTVESFPYRLEDIQFVDFRERHSWGKLIQQLQAVNMHSSNNEINLPRNAPKSVKQAVEGLNSSDSVVRSNSISTLAQIKHPLAYDALLKALYHSTEDVCIGSAIVLAQKFGEKSAKPILIETLCNGGSQLDTVATSLTMIGDINDAPVLLESLNTASNGARSAIIKALVEIAFKTEEKSLIVNGLVDTLRHHDPYLRQLVAQALGAIRDDSAVIWLKDAINDPDANVTRSVLKALKNIGTPHAKAIIKTWESDHKS